MRKVELLKCVLAVAVQAIVVCGCSSEAASKRAQCESDKHEGAAEIIDKLRELLQESRGRQRTTQLEAFLDEYSTRGKANSVLEESLFQSLDSCAREPEVYAALLVGLARIGTERFSHFLAKAVSQPVGIGLEEGLVRLAAIVGLLQQLTEQKVNCPCFGSEEGPQSTIMAKFDPFGLERQQRIQVTAPVERIAAFLSLVGPMCRQSSHASRASLSLLQRVHGEPGVETQIDELLRDVALHGDWGYGNALMALCERLHDRNSESAMDLLIELWKGGKYDRVTILHCLRAHPNRRSLPLGLEATKSTDELTRDLGVRCVVLSQGMEGEQWMTFFESLSKDPEPNVRLALLESCAGVSLGTEQVDLIMTRAKEESDERVLAQYVHTLGTVMTPKITKWIDTMAIESASPRVRASALVELTRLTRASATDPLPAIWRGVADPHERVFRVALQKIVEYGGDGELCKLRALSQASTSRPAEFTQALQRAIMELGRKPCSH